MINFCKGTLALPYVDLNYKTSSPFLLLVEDVVILDGHALLHVELRQSAQDVALIVHILGTLPNLKLFHLLVELVNQTIK